MKIKLKDCLFLRYLLMAEIGLDQSTADSILELPVEIQRDGQPDTIIDHDTHLIYQHPTSLGQFLFRVSYAAMCRFLSTEKEKDMAGLALFYMVSEYLYADEPADAVKGPPVFISIDKEPIPALVLSEILEPILGEINRPPLLVYPCHHTDTCRIIRKSDTLQRHYELGHHQMPFSEFPCILVNSLVQNQAARAADIIRATLSLQFGSKKTKSILRHLLLGSGSDLTESMIMIARGFMRRPSGMVDLLGFLETSCMEGPEDRKRLVSIQRDLIANHDDIQGQIKTAKDGLYTPQIQNQWTQWSLLSGILEKELDPMRGSMRPTTEALKEHDQEFRDAVEEKAKTKRPNEHLNFEELLEVSRDMFDHNAIEPGQLTENLLRTVRVWP